MALRSIQHPWNAEPPTEQGRGPYRRSGTSRFEEGGVEGWYAEEGSHEHAWFVTPRPFAPSRVVAEGFFYAVKANDSQREGMKMTDEEVISQVR